jgi:hypothetical protein
MSSTLLPIRFLAECHGGLRRSLVTHTVVIRVGRDEENSGGLSVLWLREPSDGG